MLEIDEAPVFVLNNVNTRKPHTFLLLWHASVLQEIERKDLMTLLSQFQRKAGSLQPGCEWRTEKQNRIRGKYSDPN